MELCPCGSELPYAECCGPIIRGEKPARTAEELMRSRYSAYVKKEIAYIRTSLHPDHRADYDESSSRAWSEGATWHGIEIVHTAAGGPEDREGEVEFIASYTMQGARQEHHERSTFKKVGDTWFFVTGKAMPQRPTRATPKAGRNDPCPCGSGKKYKKCCGQ